jgi:hypothetical protein
MRLLIFSRLRETGQGISAAWYTRPIVTRYWLLALGGVLAPLGCSSSSDADYKFGVADMEQAVVGTWSGMWGSETQDAGATADAGASDADMGDADMGDADMGDADMGDAAVDEAGARDGSTGLVPFTLVIEHPARATAHPLCDPRQFATLHPLCVSTSEMPLRATLTVSDGSFSAVELTGMLRVPGAELHEADMSLKGTTADVAIVAQWIIGKWLFCIANHATGQRLASCTLESRTP